MGWDGMGWDGIWAIYEIFILHLNLFKAILGIGFPYDSLPFWGNSQPAGVRWIGLDGTYAALKLLMQQKPLFY